MSNVIIPGREMESKFLTRLLQSKEAQLISIHGRRRIGKTHLIREFYKDKGLYIQLTGVNEATQKEQLANFHDELNSIFHHWDSNASPDSWREAFKRLVDSIKPIVKDHRVIVFFDEVPWLAKKSRFLKAFEYSWNQHLSTLPNLIVVLCGSAASWMIKNIIQNKGGLHGRLTAKLQLQPFTLKQTEAFLIHRGIRYSRQQIVELYMALGGVAQYLKAVPKGMSPTQAIQELCFSPQGLLFREFYPLFRSLFENSDKYVNIVQLLANSKSGLSISDILDKTDITSGGSFSKLLRELEEAGIIMPLADFGKKKREAHYRLIDEYSLFYLRWIKNSTISVISGTRDVNWHLQQQSQRYAVWAGYAFENLCMRHVPQIKQALGLAAVSTIESGWFGLSKEEGKAQIDIVIDRADRCINLCEIKYWSTQLSLDKTFSDQLERKRRIFKAATNTKKSVFTTLITPFGVNASGHYHYAIDQQINLDDLFT
jgi:AAA+ ATPase superfamily predicted ATPase